MLHIVQLVERQIVALEVVSSNLTMHPIFIVLFLDVCSYLKNLKNFDIILM